MITYDKYCEIRDSKGLKDGDVARKAGIQPSTFSEWKKGKCTPKYEKMSKIAEALDMDYFAFVGPVGKFSALNPNKPRFYDIEVKVDRTAILPEDDRILISDISQDPEAYKHLIEYAKLLKLKMDSKKEED